MHIHKWSKWTIKSNAEVRSTFHGGVIAERIVQVKQCQVCGLCKYKIKRIGI